MSAPAHLPDAEKTIWDEVIERWGEGADRIESPELEAYCGQVARLREAQKRISTEGLVISDPKGNPIAHPAISIEKQAQAEIRNWSGKFTPRRR